MSEVSNTPIQLLIIDDHAMFREAIAEKLASEPDMNVLAAHGSIAEAGSYLDSHPPPDVILLDFDLGGERAVDFVASIRRQGYASRILVVTAGVSGPEALQLIRTGANGILHKHHPPSTLCEVIRDVAAGEVFLEKSYLGLVFRDIDQSQADGRPALTERDRSVLRLVFQGLGNKEIGGLLSISEGAVKSAVSQLFRKLGVRTRAQLVKVALEHYSDQI